MTCFDSTESHDDKFFQEPSAVADASGWEAGNEAGVLSLKEYPLCGLAGDGFLSENHPITCVTTG
jgi:hypothetical protein